jgi:hypothetical protein
VRYLVWIRHGLRHQLALFPSVSPNRGSYRGWSRSPKAQELLGDQDLIDNSRKLGNVANYTQQLSRGSHANTSHTFVAEKAAEIGEHAANVAAHGLPVGTIARKFLASRSKTAAIVRMVGVSE